mmetsp:Transcript_10582/g.31506  ORF Transcript_10582/g.31506 Transcript_10582/m.31506 type:complete len:204 (-) Transcript_10582:955-1566(-)
MFCAPLLSEPTSSPAALLPPSRSEPDPLDEEDLADADCWLTDTLDLADRAVVMPSYWRMALSMTASSCAGKALSSSRYASTLRAKRSAFFWRETRAVLKWRMPKTKGTSPSVSPGPSTSSISSAPCAPSSKVSTWPRLTKSRSLHASPARKMIVSASNSRSRKELDRRSRKPAEQPRSSAAAATRGRLVCAATSICRGTGSPV